MRKKGWSLGKKDQFAAITDKNQQRMLNLGGNTDRAGNLHGRKVSPSTDCLLAVGGIIQKKP